MYDDNFGEYLRRTFPGIPEDEAMRRMVADYGTYRAIARATGIALVTISRWGRRLKVTPPPVFVHMRVTKPLLLEKGKGAKGKLLRLKEEEGTWLRVAVRLGVTSKELQRYRYLLGMVPKDKWKERCEGGRGLFEGYGNYFEDEQETRRTLR